MKSHQFFLQICQVRVQFVVQIDLKYFAHSVFDKTKFSKRRHLFSLNLFVFSDEDVFEAVNFVFPDLQFEFEKLDSDFSASKPRFLPSAVQTLSQSRFPALSCPPVYNMGWFCFFKEICKEGKSPITHLQFVFQLFCLKFPVGLLPLQFLSHLNLNEGKFLTKLIHF